MVLTRSLREPGGPCTKSMEVSESRMERVKVKQTSLVEFIQSGDLPSLAIYFPPIIYIGCFSFQAPILSSFGFWEGSGTASLSTELQKAPFYGRSIGLL